jgi:hypothetical protein
MEACVSPRNEDRRRSLTKRMDSHWRNSTRKLAQRCTYGYRQFGLCGCFSPNRTQVFRNFTVNGATDFFSPTALEMGPVFRATIEPDSQDVFRRSAAPHSASRCITPLPRLIPWMRTEETSGETDFLSTCRMGGRNICLLAPTFLDVRTMTGTREQLALQQGTEEGTRECHSSRRLPPC